MGVTSSGLLIGVGPQGQLPLPWLGEGLARARALTQAHALLAHGPAGVGQLEFCLLLAQAWLCERPAAPAAGQGLGAGQGAACGHCESCHLVRSRSHPDLLVVLPEALRLQIGWADDDEKPKGEAKPSREIRITQLREAIDWAQRTSGRGRAKVLLIHPADAMNGPTANALLKTLEEPPGQLRIVLGSADPERLLPTVRSRCQRVPLALPPAEQAAAWLRAQGLAEPGPLLALAGGSPLEALALAAEGLTPEVLAELPRRVAAGDPAPLQGRPIPRVVELLLKLAHDAMALAVGGAPRHFAAASLPVGGDLAALVAWQQALLRAARHDEHPWNAGLLIESLVGQAAAAWPVAPRGAQRGERPAPGAHGGGRASLHSAR
ncbi:DNA polymerase III subunit delta' [Aquabacterium sp. OR-4]|uniref:DNA polymerase III subunit delta' n=1 Tax=Aquabacterium sp. OR-4 TaxID=2978127 RepID=UPI0021B355A4|nr:DNA polymerase III subunit delta' [Aquabacterium sp. OR-4]MDT7834661.1 DNA polymerase III subunit delta' [Aquabacterium sp. OR-4]